jgi:hypothetical protein
VKIVVNILLKWQEQLLSTAVVWSRHSLREINMINFTLGVPVKTRLPFKAWTLAAIITLFSLASTVVHSHAPSDHAVYAGMIWKLVWPS